MVQGVDVSQETHSPLIQLPAKAAHIDGGGSIHRFASPGAPFGSIICRHDIGMVRLMAERPTPGHSGCRIDRPQVAATRLSAFSGAFGPDNLARFAH